MGGRHARHRVLTINLQWVEDIRDASEAFKVVKQRVGRWWRYEWGVEGRSLRDSAGALVHADSGHRHVHWLVRLPEVGVLKFLVVVLDRLTKVVGMQATVAAGACYMKPAPAPGILAKYVLKVIDSRFAARLHIKAADEGFVVEQHTSVSRASSRGALHGRLDARAPSDNQWRQP